MINQQMELNMKLLVLVVAFLPATVVGAVEYTATNNAATTPGGLRFDADIGIPHTIDTLRTASSFIWTTFSQSDQDRKPVNTISMSVDPIDGVAYTSSDGIHVSAGYIAVYQNGDVRTEIDGVLYHEATHVWQWNGQGAAPTGLIEGIADYVRLKAGLEPAAGNWVRPGEGERWDEGYSVTARFLDYCNGVGGGSFVADINREMRDGYSDELFVKLLGKSVDEMWSEYKAAYGKM